MKSATIYHSTKRIWRLIGLSGFCIAIGSLSTVYPPDASYHGSFASLVSTLGPTTIRWLMALFGLGSAAVMIACLRLVLSSNREAIPADDDGLMLRGMWGTKLFKWEEVSDIYVKTAMYGRHSNRLLKVDSPIRRSGVLSTSTIDDGGLTIQEMIATAKARAGR